MRAAILDGYHKKGCDLKLADVDMPHVGAHDVLVRVHTAGVNPLDNMIARIEASVDEVFGLRDVNKALAKVAAGGSKGKTVLRVAAG